MIDSSSANVTPARIIESHTQDSNRTLDKRSVQIPGYAGHFEFYEDIETETLQVDASTVRITTRTFGQDGNRRKALLEVKEEAKHSLPSGDSHTVRITSRSDLNGSLQVVQREIVETKSIGNDVEETNTTVLLPSVNGGFAPAVKIHQLRKRNASGTVQSEATLLRDGVGNWQVRELRQNTTRQEDSNLSTEDHLFRCNAEGKLVEVARVMGKQSDSTPGKNRGVVETYSLNIPGASPNGSLQLVERATTTQRTTAAGEQITEQQLEQRNLGDPNSGVRVSMLLEDTVHPAPSGAQAVRTVRMREANGGFAVVEVDTTRADKIPTIHIATPSENPK